MKNRNSLKVAVIGAGFSGMSAATYLAKAGYDVTVYEKLDHVGGRAQVFKQDGFEFDMGPSWYWMPDVFESYFGDFGYQVADLYKLERLDPGYRVYFAENEFIDIGANWKQVEALFEELEPGSAAKLNRFMDEAEVKYRIAFSGFIDKPGHSVWEFVNLESLKGGLKLDLLKSVKSLVAKYFKHPKLRSILEFPVLFLGAMPEHIPALYTLMNYADLKLGTWYPQGGMVKIAEAMQLVAEKQGVKFKLGAAVQKVEVEKGEVIGILVKDEFISTDIVIGAADYHFIDKHLLPDEYSNYSKSYWDKRVMAPSALLYYIALDTKVKGLEHHNLFFDEDFDLHGHEIYRNPKWPTSPQMYVSAASKTDDSIAPEGCEALVGLIPVAVDLDDTEEVRQKYQEALINKIEKLTGESIRNNIQFVKSYAHKNFIADYNAFKGNAYGLANTLKQTAFLKPKIKNAKLHNLFYAGQLTVPGPGVPPALISGKIAANEILRQFK